MKSKRLWTVEHRQVGNERTNLLQFLHSRDLVANVELELVLKDGIGEPDLQDNNRNQIVFPLFYTSTNSLASQNVIWCVDRRVDKQRQKQRDDWGINNGCFTKADNSYNTHFQKNRRLAFYSRTTSILIDSFKAMWKSMKNKCENWRGRCPRDTQVSM